ncbi:hypothetical protein A3I25_00910 [Candidatus Nomurabacteria bacterium RIFCSPLOWO2_02_FULL_42_17]|uniref:CopG family transcriptional regulator n=1 Tax=Candidatus Nomurabacteria bacterium RIFCSPLOWO2_02_FULL_42_17 TaxID=1801789 RepID=A0A1F6XQ07_9BACT|nr:MAG: hypothetical protein UV08_C0037G0005 [Parcubacteria group bacterium GW2011_GWA2_42_18]OGI96161.1 MAG: hypothetical protein A3I25_00910 [Candidatus Nomurabacteria bacterium RIFCSPLOWO2_02_FULL_42_17]
MASITTKKRLNITLSPDLNWSISKIAKRDKVPTATKAAELIRLALIIEEDSVWEKLAGGRDTKGVRFIPHARVWK